MISLFSADQIGSAVVTLQYARESVKSQHFVLETKVLDWIKYFKIMLLNMVSLFFFPCDQKGLASDSIK